MVADESRVMVIKEAVKLPGLADKIALSLSDPFVVKVYGDELRDLIANGVDLIFCNKKEALAFANMLTWTLLWKILSTYQNPLLSLMGLASNYL